MKKIALAGVLFICVCLVACGDDADDFETVPYNPGELWGVHLRDWMPEGYFRGAMGLDHFMGSVPENGLIITNYSRNSKNVRIPASIDGKPVIAVGKEAFRGGFIAIGGSRVNEFRLKEYRMKSVTIPDSIIWIGAGAFSANDLTSVTIPDSVRAIGKEAFRSGYDTNKLKNNVTIGNSVFYIGESAFKGNQLTNVVIPESVLQIDREAFKGNQLTNVVIPESVLQIDREAFEDNQLTNVVIPESVFEIGDHAFSKNPLTSVTVPDNVKIGWGAFSVEDSLTTIIIGANCEFEYSSFPGIFHYFYENTRRRAGRYILVKNGLIGSSGEPIDKWERAGRE